MVGVLFRIDVEVLDGNRGPIGFLKEAFVKHCEECPKEGCQCSWKPVAVFRQHRVRGGAGPAARFQNLIAGKMQTARLSSSSRRCCPDKHGNPWGRTAGINIGPQLDAGVRRFG